jgi:ferredoxin/flavodoxin---NADP+ reductase
MSLEKGHSTSSGPHSAGRLEVDMASLDYNATIVERAEVAPGLIILRVKPDDLSFRFQAGQYTVLGLRRSAPQVAEAEPEEPPVRQEDPEKLIRRAYSVASSSREDEYVEFYLTLVTSGELTPRLFALRTGDRVFMGPKATGVFTLNRVPEGLHAVLVATGTGLAPYMSMLRTEVMNGGPRRYLVLHGARFSWDLGYRTELTALARQWAHLVYLPAVSRAREDSSWTGLAGYLQDLILSPLVEERAGFPVDPDHAHDFLCGNPAMIEASKERLAVRGFVPDKGKVVGTLHVEEYW